MSSPTTQLFPTKAVSLLLLIFISFAAVTISPLAAQAQTTTTPTPREKKELTICVLMWGSISDGGFTEAHNDGLQDEVRKLNNKFGSDLVFKYELVHDAHMGTEAEQEQRMATQFALHDCDIFYATFSDTFGRWSNFVDWVQKRPQTLFVVEDPQFIKKPEIGRFSNLVITGNNCDRSWYLAGYAAAYQAARGACIGIVVAFPNFIIESQYAFQKGVAHAAAELNDLEKKAVILPVNDWAAKNKDELAANILLDIMKCHIIGHITDEPVVNQIVVKRSGTASLWSLGWTFDRSNDYGDSVLVSVLRDYHEMFRAVLEQWIDRTPINDNHLQIFPCPITNLGSKASTTAKTAFTNMNQTLDLSQRVWTKPQWTDKTGTSHGSGTLSETEVVTMVWQPEDLVQSEGFKFLASCGDGKSAAYVANNNSQISADGAEVVLECKNCPVNTNLTASTTTPTSSAELSVYTVTCTTCEKGLVAAPGAAVCTTDQADDSSGLSTTILIVIIVVVVVVVAVVAAIAATLISRQGRGASENAPQGATNNIVVATSRGDGHNEPFNSSSNSRNPDASRDGSSGNEQYLIRFDPLNLSQGSWNSRKSFPGIAPNQHTHMSGSTTSGRSYPIAGNSTTDVGIVDLEVEKERRVQMIKNNFFYVGQIIGKGATGVVYRVVLQDGSTVAMKELMGTQEVDCRELQIAANLPPHPNILKHYVVRYNAEKCSTMIFMELMTGGSLRSVVKEVHRSLADVTARAFTTQIISALSFLHKANVVHRDLKCDNVLLDSDGRCKVADFGTAKQITDSVTSLSFVGTPLWMAPEILLGQESVDNLSMAKKADVWAVGILVAEMLGRGKPPWPEFDSAIGAIQYIEKGGELVLPTGISPAAKRFIQVCTQKDPNARPNCEDLLSHEWLTFDPTSSVSSSMSDDHEEDTLPLKEPSKTYTIGPVIGIGAFGTVHKAQLADNSIVAVKSMTFNSKERSLSKRLRRLSREISTMKALEHPNIIRYLFTDKQSLASHETSDSVDHVMLIFMEYIGGGTMKSLVDKKTGMKEEAALPYIHALFKGLGYLHSKNIAHRDVKPSNCLVCPAPIYTKVGDFGTAACLGTNVTVSLTMQGTLLYMAPEIVHEKTPSTAADVWSAGVTAMEIITGKSPWAHAVRGNSLSVASFVASNEALVLPDSLSENAKSFLMRCFVRDPVKRATVDELLRHPWLNGGGGHVVAPTASTATSSGDVGVEDDGVTDNSTTPRTVVSS